jgi:CubicO group peptidase (beta-lactamase class C family)
MSSTVKESGFIMNSFQLSIILAALFFLFSLDIFGQHAPIVQANSAKELVGLWEAKHRFGPDVRGTLLIRQTGSGWRAEVAGRFAPVRVDGDSISFELPGGQGRYQGEFDTRRAKIVGHWIQPAITFESNLPYASPVTLIKNKHGIWRGEVLPLEVTLTFYLMVKVNENGSVGAFLINPERNLGWTSYRSDRIESVGRSVKLFAANNGTESGRVVAEGSYNADDGTLSFFLRGEIYEFKRTPADAVSDFYPRGRPGVTYAYNPPPMLDDGWQTGSLETVGISRSGIEKFIQTIIDTPIDSVNSWEDHGILIARNGKLVLEEYFHGENREKPHDTRSASKSMASDLMGAAMQAGVSVSPESFVYQVMNGGAFPPDLEPRKRALKVEQLLTMSSGLDCDDNDANSPGVEDNMWDQTEQPDFYKWTLALKMVRDPGEKQAYCSAGANLVGGIVKRSSGKPLPELFHDLLAEPLNIKHYYVPISPTGDVTFTGGHRYFPRDFMKFAQLHMNDGNWNGRRIFSAEWSRRATSPLHNFPSYKLDYGYLWWVKDYPYKGRTIRAFFASGNGGQIAMAIPNLDLVMAFYRGNFGDKGYQIVTNIYVPNYILPTIEK